MPEKMQEFEQCTVAHAVQAHGGLHSHSLYQLVGPAVPRIRAHPSLLVSEDLAWHRIKQLPKPGD
jgi:hypothetical protein